MKPIIKKRKNIKRTTTGRPLMMAERETRTLRGKVSQQLRMLLQQQLEPFCEMMQKEMAEDLVIFTYEHIAHTTGCLSADCVLNVCYSWIAEEQGVFQFPRIH